jgi:hypothetical protein
VGIVVVACGGERGCGDVGTIAMTAVPAVA